MRWSGLFGCFAGLITTLSISTYLQLSHRDASGDISTYEEYTGRLEAAYETFLAAVETQEESVPQPPPERTTEIAPSIDADHSDSPINADNDKTPAPTSTIVVVQSPKKTMLHPDHHKSPQKYYDNNLPTWITRQLPCAGTGSQYCARGLEPAVPAPKLQHKTEMFRIPNEWSDEVCNLKFIYMCNLILLNRKHFFL
jgi:hypothetical protein